MTTSIEKILQDHTWNDSQRKKYIVIKNSEIDSKQVLKTKKDLFHEKSSDSVSDENSLYEELYEILKHNIPVVDINKVVWNEEGNKYLRSCEKNADECYGIAININSKKLNLFNISPYIKKDKLKEILFAVALQITNENTDITDDVRKDLLEKLEELFKKEKLNLDDQGEEYKEFQNKISKQKDELQNKTNKTNKTSRQKDELTNININFNDLVSETENSKFTNSIVGKLSDKILINLKTTLQKQEELLKSLKTLDSNLHIAKILNINSEKNTGNTEEDIRNTEEDIRNTEKDIGNTEEDIKNTEEDIRNTEKDIESIEKYTETIDRSINFLKAITNNKISTIENQYTRLINEIKIINKHNKIYTNILVGSSTFTALLAAVHVAIVLINVFARQQQFNLNNGIFTGLAVLLMVFSAVLLGGITYNRRNEKIINIDDRAIKCFNDFLKELKDSFPSPSNLVSDTNVGAHFSGSHLGRQ